VMIDIPEVLVHLRGRVVAERSARRRGLDPEARAMQALGWVLADRRRYELAQKLARVGQLPIARGGRIRRLPLALSGWTETRDAPAVPAHAFRDWWRAREAAAVPRGYRGAGDATAGERLARFAERVADYRATVHQVAAAELAATLAAALQRRGVWRLVVPADLPAAWRPGGVELLVDGEPPLPDDALDRAGGVLTGCRLGIAETGTIVLDGGGGQGRRALTLLPDYHLCVVEAARVVASVPEAITELEPAARERRPLTLISGPSATSDIELDRVEGVHGPRTLEVVIVAAPA
jgi:L-lactate dehydrogenase complex protein LldG